MTKKYYYFIVSLPELRLDDYKEPYRVREFIAQLDELLCPCHRRLVDDVLSFYDNRNLIDILFKKDLDPFEVLGRFTRAQLKDIAAGDEDSGTYLPAYMRRFLEEVRAAGAEGEADRRAGALRLEELFYTEMTRHENDFIRRYFRFDRALRDVGVALGRRRFPSLPVKLVGADTDDDPVIPKLITSAAPDFGLAGELDFIGRLVEAYDAGDPVAIEKVCDTARWRQIEALTVFSYFEELMLCERWLHLDPHRGEEALEKHLALSTG